MKTRQEIKAQAKQAFYNRYWLCVGVTVVAGLTVSAAASASAGIGALLISGPVAIGLCVFSLAVYVGEPASFDTLFDKGFANYGRKLGGYLWMQLFIYLWSLLFIVPGVVKSFSYAMTPYILGDCPNVRAQDALKISMRMMNGHKWELFVFYLSFLGWDLLSVLTCGLLAVFFVGPYKNNALAGYYQERKKGALLDGVVTEAELA